MHLKSSRGQQISSYRNSKPTPVGHGLTIRTRSLKALSIYSSKGCTVLQTDSYNLTILFIFQEQHFNQNQKSNPESLAFQYSIQTSKPIRFKYQSRLNLSLVCIMIIHTIWLSTLHFPLSPTTP